MTAGRITNGEGAPGLEPRIDAGQIARRAEENDDGRDDA